MANQLISLGLGANGDLTGFMLFGLAPGTPAVYAPTIDDLLSWPVREPIAIAEIETSISDPLLTAFTETAGRTDVWEVPFPTHRQTDVLATGLYAPCIGVRFDDADLVHVESLDDVEDVSGSWWWDAPNELLYVHAPADGDPADEATAIQVFVRLHMGTTGIVLATPPPRAYTDLVRAAEPMAYWRLGETTSLARDSVGTAHGTVSADGVTRGTRGLPIDNANNPAYEFDGLDGEVELDAPPSRAAGEAFTVAWLMTPNSNQPDTLAGLFTDGTGGGLFWDRANQRLRTVFGVTTNTSAGSVPSDTKIHVAVTVSVTGTVKVYVNGVEVTSAAAAFGAFTFSPAWLGSDDGSSFFMGVLDEVAYYARALTAAEIASLAAAGIYDTEDPDNGVYYHPWITGDLPVSRERAASDLYGVHATSGGELRLTNPDAVWYRLTAIDSGWNWKNKIVRILLGGRVRETALPRSLYASMRTLLIEDVACDDSLVTFALKPFNRLLEQTVPRTPLFASAYPNLGDGVSGQKKWIGYGRAVIAPDLIDTTVSQGKYLVADAAYQDLDAVHNVWAVSKATAVKTLLTLTTHYTVDLVACTVTVVHVDYPYADYSLLVDATGKTDGSGNPINTAGGIIKDLLTTHVGVRESDLDIDSFTQAELDVPELLSMWLKSPRAINSIISSSEPGFPSICASALVTLRQTADGLWNIKARSSLSETPTIALGTTDFADFRAVPNLDAVVTGVNVYFAREIAPDGSGTWDVATADDERARFLLGGGTHKEDFDFVDLYTFLAAESDASSLAQRYLILAGGPRLHVEFKERGTKLFRSLIADTVSVTRSPAPSSVGRFVNEPLELIELEQRYGPVPSVAGLLRDVRGLGGLGWSWSSESGPVDWDAASVEERALYGFWADDDGFIDPPDPDTQDIKAWS